MSVRRVTAWAAVLLGGLFAGCSQSPEEPSSGGAEPPPNILLIVVDTLRYDHLSFYGYGRDTSPEIRRRLVDRGVVVEDAYAQAPWTLPSMASMLTGRPPAEMLDGDGLPWGIPEQADTLAEGLASRGYRTAAFVANPTLHRGNGFAQGFDDFTTAPYDIASMARHADDINGAALPWLKAAPPEPFFLYLHYLDPHDPYTSPDLVDGRSEFYPDYAGKIRGTDIHGLYLGEIEMEDQERDLAHIAALYDSEIRYVDRRIGELLDAIPTEVMARTLVVLTSDHGEELFDHGGWKHGETLYEEQIHVPLVVRWDDRLPAGARRAGTVRLLDLAPTLLAASGAPSVDPEMPGHDLLPALAGAPLPKLRASARHFGSGPTRLAQVDGKSKNLFFDRHAAFAPKDDREARLWRRDIERMGRFEAYDLATDPGERTNLAGGGGFPRGSASAAMLADLDPSLEGLRIVASGLGEGQRLSGRIEVDGLDVSVVRPLFLGPGDTFEVDGGALRFELSGDGLDKGFSVAGALRSLTAVDLTVDGVDIEPSLPTRAAGAGPWSLRDLLVETYLPAAAADREGASVFLWTRLPRRPFGEGERDDETLRRLRALGYVQ